MVTNGVSNGSAEQSSFALGGLKRTLFFSERTQKSNEIKLLLGNAGSKEHVIRISFLATVKAGNETIYIPGCVCFSFPQWLLLILAQTSSEENLLPWTETQDTQSVDKGARSEKSEANVLRKEVYLAWFEPF